MEPSLIAVKDIETHDALQPRDPRATDFKDRNSYERQSENHVTGLRGFLEANPSADLEAILACRIDGTLYVVDGHHRLEATRLAQRDTIKARIKTVTMERAVRLSRIVNISHRSLSLSKGQLSESVWQHIIDITRGGMRTLVEAGSSERKVRDLFCGISKSTVNSMVNQLNHARELKDNPKLDEENRNAYSRWPTWRTVRKRLNPKFDEDANDPPSQMVTRLAVKLAAMIDRYGLVEASQAWQLALEENGLDRYVESDDDEDDLF